MKSGCDHGNGIGDGFWRILKFFRKIWTVQKVGVTYGRVAGNFFVVLG